MYANSFFAQIEYNGRLVPFIGIIRTTPIASATFGLTYFGAKLGGATGHNDRNLFRNKYIVIVLTLLSSEHMG